VAAIPVLGRLATTVMLTIIKLQLGPEDAVDASSNVVSRLSLLIRKCSLTSSVSTFFLARMKRGSEELICQPPPKRGRRLEEGKPYDWHIPAPSLDRLTGLRG
jgi:hypothetical protein